uniref:Retrotransposon gag domain-containing protein n=1 Tax=Trichogramma kaykai TaxID=54128 RepID=A0ABD2VYF6_9HYME
MQLLNQVAKEPEEEESTENSTPDKQGNELKTQEKDETQEKQQPVSSTMGTEDGKNNAIKKEEQTKAAFNATMAESLSSLFKNLLSGIAIFNGESKRNTTRFIKDLKLAKLSISPSQESEFVRRLKPNLVGPKIDNIDLTDYSTIHSLCDFLNKTFGFNKTQIALITELAQFHQRENETIYEYYSRLKDLSEELEAAQRRNKPEHIFFSQNIQNLCLNAFTEGLIEKIRIRMSKVGCMTEAYNEAAQIELEVNNQRDRREGGQISVSCALCGKTSHKITECDFFLAIKGKTSEPTLNDQG